MREISAKLSKNAEVKASDVTVTDAGGRKLNVKDVKSDGTTVTVTANGILTSGASTHSKSPT